MPFDIESLTAEECVQYLVVGRQYATEDVLAQADKTMLGYRHYGHLLVAHGVGPDEGALMGELVGLLRETDGGHIQVVDARKLLNKTYDEAKRTAKDERINGRTLTSMCISPLNRANQGELARRATLVLEQTSRVDTDKQLIDQMKTLHDLLSVPDLAPVIANRGGPTILAGLASARTSLLAAVQERAGKPEVAAAAQRRDILDGAVVTLCRAARDASRVAARRLGQPAIAAAFKLDLLRRSRSSTPAEPDEGDPTTELPEPDL
jgi:hypothetical protein